MVFTTIKNRFIFSIMAFIVVMFSISAIWTYYYFKHQTSDLIQSQQFTMVTSIAKGLDEKLISSHNTLIAVAGAIPHKIFSNPQKAQTWLDDRKGIRIIFNNGLFLFTPEGKLLVENPYLPQRRGRDFSFREYFQQTVATGKPYISLPYQSSKGAHHPTIMMTVPIIAADGRMLGILGGAIDLLSEDNVFKTLIDTKVGNTGYLYLYAPDRTLIVHPLFSRIMQKDVPPGANRLFDLAIDGFEGSGETVTSRGLKAISSFKRLQTNGWILAANYPVAEAYRPIYLFRNFYLIGILLLIMASVLIARILGISITRPITDLVEQIQVLTQTDAQNEQRLVCNHFDELKLLADSFNNLLLVLQENRKRLADIIDFLPDATLAIDKNKRVTIWNRAIEEMTGIPAAEMIGKGDYAYTIPFYGKARPQLMDLVFEDNEETLSQYINVTNEGNSYSAEAFCNAIYNNRGAWIFCKASPLRDQSGSIIGVIERIRDITDRKRKDEALSKNEEQLRTILKTAMDGFLLTDLEGRFLQTNDAYCQMIGYSEAELLAMDILDVDSALSAEAITANIQTIIKQEGRGTRLETRHRRKDGTIIDVEISIQYRPIEGGRLVTFLRDITERKRAEEQLSRYSHDLETLVQERTNKLQISEQRFRSFVENANDIVFLLTPDGIFTYVSPNWKDAFGYELAETIGKPFPPFVHPDDAANCYAFMQKAAESGEKQRDVEYRVRHRNGSWIWYSANGSFVNDPINNQLNFLGIGRDISESKKAEEEKLALERQLLHTQKLESLGVMASGIAHDFNNLLQSILGNVELAAKGFDPNKHLSRAMISGKRAKHITNLMLDYVGKGSTDKAALDLNQLVNENTDMLKVAASSSINIQLSLAKKLPAIMADKAQMQQLVMNLITNATEAITELPGIIKITTGTLDCDKALLDISMLQEKPEPGHYVFLQITDNGSGIDEGTLQRLFDPFFTTKFTGRGLGLSAVMGIIKSHSGALFVDTEIGKGTTFRVMFPASESLANAIEPESAAITQSTHPGKLLSGMALVVDDDKAVLKNCATMFKYLGFKVITARDGKDAVAKYQEYADEITVVLMDLTMPNMDGITAMNEIHRTRPDARVILASGYNEHEMSEKYGNIKGAYSFIRKPYDLNEIETELRRVIQA